MTLDTSEVHIEIPGSAISGSGTLSVKPDSRGKGLTGVTISLSPGAKLVGKATLDFAYAYKRGEPAPLVVSSGTASGDLTIASDISKTATGVTVQTTHFSNWFIQGWNTFLDQQRGFLDSLFAQSQKEAQPSCANTAEAAKVVAVTRNPTTKQVVWCLDQASSGPVMKAANARSYIANLEYTAGLSLTNPPDVWTDSVPALMPWLALAPNVKGDRTELMDPGQEYDLSITGAGAQGVLIQPNGGAYLVNALWFGLPTVAMLAPFLPKGTPKTEKALVETLAQVNCLADFKETASANVTSADQAAKYVSQAIPAVVGCVSDLIKKLYPGDFFLAVLISGLAWLESGVKTLAAGLVGAWDSALNITGGWELDVKYTPPSKCPDGTIEDAVFYSATGFAAVCDRADDPGTDIGFGGTPYIVYDDIEIRVVEPQIGDVLFDQGFVTGQGHPAGMSTSRPDLGGINIGSTTADGPDDYGVGDYAFPIVREETGSHARPF